MALVYKDRVSQTCSAPSGSAAFVLSGAATTGFQTWSALANADTAIYSASDVSGGWEVGVGTWATSGTTLTRTVILASSNAGSAVTFSGTVTVDLSNNASMQMSMYLASTAITPGGRLTLTSGVPVTTTDVTAATNIYYTPHTHNKISLWNGSYWQTIAFSEYTLALGTLTSGKPYDVFAYLSGGALALEVLVWASDTARATTVTIQDGRYCKSGDKTRFLLGSFYTTSTTTTADAEETRYLSNMFNRATKLASKTGAGSHSYTTGAERDWNNDTSSYLYSLVSDPGGGFIPVALESRVTAGVVRIFLNGSPIVNNYLGIYGSGLDIRGTYSTIGNYVAGRNLTKVTEYGVAAATFQGAILRVPFPC